MKKLDLVKLVNNQKYNEYNLKANMYGIVINDIKNPMPILFFNHENLGDYVIIDVDRHDIVVEKEKLPITIQNEIIENLDKIISKSKNILKPNFVKEYDMVELLVEDEKYTKHGIHKGTKGCVMNNRAIQDYIEVDFSGIDFNGNFYGDCIAVKIQDLKVIND